MSQVHVAAVFINEINERLHEWNIYAATLAKMPEKILQSQIHNRTHSSDIITTLSSMNECVFIVFIVVKIRTHAVITFYGVGWHHLALVA